MLKRAALPEAAAFAELEHVSVAGIRVRSIDDDPSASNVVVELDAVSDAVLNDYLDQLNAGQPEPKWHIWRISALEGGSGDVANRNASAEQFTRSATLYRPF